MSTTNDGGPVFPQTIYQLEEGHWEGKYAIDKQVHGMSLRDYFAGQALTGNLAYSVVNPMSGNYQSNATPDDVARACYGFADAMLAAREAK